MTTSSEPAGSTHALVSWVVAMAAFFLVGELVGARNFIERFETRGNLPPGYYWAFSSLLGLTLLLPVMLRRRNVGAVKMMLVGGAISYFLSVCLFVGWMIIQLGSFENVRETWNRLGTQQALSNAFLEPAALLGLVSGLVLFLAFSLLLHHLGRKASIGNGAGFPKSSP